MRFTQAIDLYFEDMRREGRIRSPRTEVGYRQVLDAHADDIDNRDPRVVGRADVKRTLARWPNPNTQAARHSVLNAFYDWAIQEGIRETNPARQVRRAKKQPTSVYRLTKAEAAALLAAAESTREQRVAFLGLCAGIRSAELRGMQGRHFRRPGFIWVSSDIAKRGQERWVPVLPELQPVVDDINLRVPDDHYILPSSSAGGWGSYTFWREDPTKPLSTQTLQRTVHQLARRAGISAHIHPHLLRHAFADHVARSVGLFEAQELLGHADVQTTQIYVGKPTLEELATAIEGLRFAIPPAAALDGRDGEGGIRTLVSIPLTDSWRVVELFSPAGRREFEERVALYATHYGRPRNA